MMIKKTKKYFYLFLILVLSTFSVKAEDVGVNKICHSVKDVPISQNIISKGKLKKCNAYISYYGLKDFSHYKQAFKCAEQNEDYKILSLLYANGKGVIRNFTLALHYACLRSAPEREYNQFILLLNDYQNKKEYTQEFNGCEAENDFDSTVCWGYEMERKSHEDYLFYKQMSDSFRLYLKEKLQYFDLRYNSYAEHHAYYELENENIPHVKYMVIEIRALKEAFLLLMQQISQCTIAAASEEEYKQADAILNKIYVELRRNKNLFTKLNIKQKERKLEAIKQTELYWIKYKDNMSSLSHLNCPNLPPYSVLTILTKQRTEQLQDILHRFD